MRRRVAFPPRPHEHRSHAKILRLNVDAATLRALRFAAGEGAGPAARLLRLWRDLASRPPSLDPNRIRDAAAALDLLAPNADALAESQRERVRQGEDPVSAAAKVAASAFSAFPDAPAAEAEILALSVFDLVLAAIVVVALVNVLLVIVPLSLPLTRPQAVSADASTRDAIPKR